MAMYSRFWGLRWDFFFGRGHYSAPRHTGSHLVCWETSGSLRNAALCSPVKGEYTQPHDQSGPSPYESSLPLLHPDSAPAHLPVWMAAACSMPLCPCRRPPSPRGRPCPSTLADPHSTAESSGFGPPCCLGPAKWGANVTAKERAPGASGSN